MKKVFYGWVNKGVKVKNISIFNSQWDGFITLADTFLKRDKKEYWEPKSWPPRKVKITVEDVE